MKITTNKLPKSEIEIDGELDADIFESYFTKALKKLGENVALDGFRKGKVPENVLLSKIPEISILEEMAEMALAEHYPKILEQEKIDAISHPQISITKLARKNPLGFKIKTATMPDFTLPEYKNIAKEILRSDLGNSKRSDFEVTNEDVENTIMDIRKSRAPKKHVAEHVHDENVPHEHKEEEIKEEDLPAFNDEFVQALGPFTDVMDFKTKLKENIKIEKENAQKEKTRLKMIEKIIDATKIEVPEILIDLEVNKILYRMESDITTMGLKFEDYLKHLNKTIEDIKKEFRGDGEKKAKLALVLNKISTEEKIVADEEQIAKEVAQILAQYKDADPGRVRLHAENVLINEKIFQFLENL